MDETHREQKYIDTVQNSARNKDNITATVILPRQLGFIYHKSWIVLFNIHRRTKTCEIKFLLLQD